MKMIAILFVIFAFSSSAYGSCPVTPAAPGSDIMKTVGRWYLIEERGQSELPIYYSNITIDVTPLENGKFNAKLGQVGSKEGYDTLLECGASQNSCTFTFMTARGPLLLTNFIFDTDYDNYLASYICMNPSGNPQFGGAAFLSRTNNMSASKYAQLFFELSHLFKSSED